MYGVLTEITPTGRINMEAVRFEGCPDKYGRYEVMNGSYDRDDIIRQFERAMSRRYRTLLPSFHSNTPIYPSVKEVIFNNPATVVIWADGTKTVVKCQPGDTYSEELGLAMCISKKFFGNKGNFNEVFKKWIPDDKDTDIEGMREALNDFCNENSCGSCVLHGDACRCGRGVHFKTGTNGKYDMSDNEIVEAYNKVFEKKEV